MVIGQLTENVELKDLKQRQYDRWGIADLNDLGAKRESRVGAAYRQCHILSSKRGPHTPFPL